VIIIGIDHVGSKFIPEAPMEKEALVEKPKYSSSVGSP